MEYQSKTWKTEWEEPREGTHLMATAATVILMMATATASFFIVQF